MKGIWKVNPERPTPKTHVLIGRDRDIVGVTVTVRKRNSETENRMSLSNYMIASLLYEVMGFLELAINKQKA